MVCTNRGLQNTTTLVIMVDGKVVFKGDIGGAEDLRLANVKGTDGWAKILDRFAKIPVKLTAGPHKFVVGFIDRSHVESDDNVGVGGGRGGGGVHRRRDCRIPRTCSWKSRVRTTRRGSLSAPAGL